MRSAIMIQATSFTSRPNTPRGSSQSFSLSPRPRLQAKLNEGSPPSLSVLRQAMSEVRMAIPAQAAEKQEEEVQYSGGGMGKGRKVGGGRGDHSENWRIREYYRELLRSDPSNPLLLRNYGKFSHEVEGDVEGAEECYGRAILASPEDGELLSLYGELVWEAQRDEERAGAYFQRAAEASPNDCYVLGSYAHFLWDTEEDRDEEEKRMAFSSTPLVGLYI